MKIVLPEMSFPVFREGGEAGRVNFPNIKVLKNALVLDCFLGTGIKGLALRKVAKSIMILVT